MLGLVLRARVRCSMQAKNRISINPLTPFGAQAFAARNLELLASIENTLDALSADTKLVHAIDEGFQEVGQKLAGFGGEPIDPEGRFQTLLSKSSDGCARIHRDICLRQRSACTDPDLRSSDGLADACSDFILAVDALHDTIERLREWVADHDAVLEPSTGQRYANAEALFDALLTGQ